MLIQKANYIDNYKIEVFFSDGTKKVIDLFDYLNKHSHPYSKKLLDKKLFRVFYIDYGTICWGDNDFDISPFDAYSGEFDTCETPLKTLEVAEY